MSEEASGGPTNFSGDQSLASNSEPQKSLLIIRRVTDNSHISNTH